MGVAVAESWVNVWWPAAVLTASTPSYRPGAVGEKWTGSLAHCLALGRRGKEED